MSTQSNHSEIDEEWAYGLSNLEAPLARLFDAIPHHRKAEFADDLMLWARHQADEALGRSIESLSAARYSKSAVMDALGISKTRLDRLLGNKPVTFSPIRREWATPEDAIDLRHLMSA